MKAELYLLLLYFSWPVIRLMVKSDYMFKSINDTLSFILELAMLGAFAYAGFHWGNNPVIRYALGIGLPAIVVLFWANRMAPKAKKQFPNPWLLIVTLLLFEAAALSLYLTGAHLWAAIMAVVALINVGVRLVLNK